MHPDVWYQPHGLSSFLQPSTFKNNLLLSLTSSDLVADQDTSKHSVVFGPAVAIFPLRNTDSALEA